MESGLRMSQRLFFSVSASVFLLTILIISIIPYDVKGVEGLNEHMDEDQFGLGGDDRFGGLRDDQFGFNDRLGMRDDYPFKTDDFYPQGREDMMGDIADQRAGLQNEVLAGGKRFKLYEKKGLTHKNAALFCKKREGKLAQAMNVDEMQRLQTLLMKAKMVSTNLWVGADKKEWKQHSSKQLGRQFKPDLGPNAMMMGGGPTEMCPALSTSTRALNPAECYREYPFVCEYLPGKGKLPKSKKSKNGTKTVKKKARKIRQFDEMRKKREVVLLPSPEPEPQPEPEPTQSVITSETTATVTNSESSFSTSTDEATTSFSPGTEKQDTATPSAEHNIGFYPKTIAAQKPEPTPLLPDPIPTMEAVKPSPPRFDSATARMFLKLHTSLTVDPNALMSGYMDPVVEAENSIGTESGVSVVTEMGMASTEIDPDQQMVNLIDEQSASMSLDPVQPEPEPEAEPEPEPDASSTTTAAASARQDLSTNNPTTLSPSTPENNIMNMPTMEIPSVTEITSNKVAATTSESSKLSQAAISTSIEAASTSSTTIPLTSSSVAPMTTIPVETVELTASPRMEPPTTIIIPDGTSTDSGIHADKMPETGGNHALAEESAKRPMRNASMSSLLQPTGTLAPAVVPKPKEDPASSSSMPGFLLTPKTRERSTNVGMDFNLNMGSTSDISEEFGVSTASSRLGKFNGLLEPKLWQGMQADPILWEDAFNPGLDIQLDDMPVLNRYVAG